MDVAGSFANRIRQDQVDQLYDWSLIAAILELRKVHFRFLRSEFQLVLAGRGQLLIYLLDLDGLFGPVVFLYRALDGALCRHHRLDPQPGDELDLVQGDDVSGIRDSHDEGHFHLEQGKHLVSNRGPPGDQSDDVLIDPQVFQIDPGDSVLVAESPGTVFIGDISKLC